MGGQHKVSGTNYDSEAPLVPPSPVLPDDGWFEWIEIPSILVWYIYFSQVMSPHIPLTARFTLKINGMPVDPSFTPSWFNNQTLHGAQAGVASLPTTVTLSYDGLDPLFATLEGVPVDAFTDFILTPV